jgi:hypothetical protein
VEKIRSLLVEVIAPSGEKLISKNSSKKEKKDALVWTNLQQSGKEEGCSKSGRFR